VSGKGDSKVMLVQTMTTHVKMEVQFHLFLTLALVGSVWSTTNPGFFTLIPTEGY
jgi:hypothetical protein